MELKETAPEARGRGGRWQGCGWGLKRHGRRQSRTGQAAAGIVPGGEFGPSLVFGSVSLDGGVIGLAVAPADEAATTLPQFYVTTDFLPLSDGSLLPGVISAELAAPATGITLDVGNGNLLPAAFTLTALNGSDVVATETVLLEAFGTSGSFVASLSVSAPQITGFTVTSDQPAGFKLFSVDTIRIVPEPGTALLLLAGLSLMGWRPKSR